MKFLWIIVLFCIVHDVAVDGSPMEERSRGKFRARQQRARSVADADTDTHNRRDRTNSRRSHQHGHRELTTAQDPDVFRREGFTEEEAEWLASPQTAGRVMARRVMASPAGIKGRITQKGLDFASTLAINLLMKELRTLTIPDQTHDIGPADVTISGIKVHRFPRPQSSLNPIPSPGYGLRWAATGLSPIIKADWTADIDLGLWTVTKSGSATFVGEDIHFRLDFMMDKDANGRPTPEVISCECDGEISLEFEGGWSDILDVGSSLFNGQVRDLITAQICFQAKKEINTQLGENLDDIPMIHEIADLYLLDMSLVQAPLFYQDAIEVLHKGAVYLADDIQEPPFTPRALPPRHQDDDKMFYFTVTDYTINSGFYATYLGNIIQYTVTADLVPEEHRGYLDTTCPTGVCLGTIFTELPSLYPNQTAGVDVRATSAPHVTINGSVFNVAATGSADVFVEVDGEKQVLFAVEVNMSSTCDVAFGGDKVLVNITNLETSVGVVSSSIGDVGSSFLYESILRVITQQLLIPRLTELGERGFDIPTVKGVEVVNPVVIRSETPGVFVVGTDLDYNINKLKRLLNRKRFNKRNKMANKKNKRKMAAKKTKVQSE